MKFITKHKNIFLILMIIFLMIITFGSVVYTVEASKITNYEVIPNGNVRINSIWINGSEQKLSKFAVLHELTYDEEKGDILLNEPLKIKLSSIYEFNIIFETNNDSGNVILKDSNNLNETLELNTEKDGTYLYVLNFQYNKMSIMNNYLKNDFSILHLIIVIISGFIYYLMFRLINLFIINLKKGSINYKHILGYFLACLVLSISTIYILMEVFDNYAIIIYIAILLFGLLKIKDYLKDKIHYLFIYLFIPIGILFALIMPIGHVPDESAHFYKAHILSNKVLLNDLDKDGDYCVKANPTLNDVLGEYNFGVQDAKFTLMPRAFYSNYLKQYKEVYDNEMTCNRSVSKLYFVAYVNTTLWLIIAKVLRIPILLMFLLGRLANFIFYIFVLYYCLKTIPKYKKGLFIAGTLPIAIQSAAAINQDCVHNAIFFLLFTQIIKAINSDKPITIKEIASIITISIILSMCKLGYFPIIFLCLIIPSKRFKNNSSKLISKAALVLPMLIAFVITYFVFWRTEPSSTTAIKTYSILSLFNNPIDFIRLYASTIKEKGFYMLCQGLVDGFAYSTKYNPTKISFVVGAAYSLMLFERSNVEKNKKEYIASILVVSAMIGLLILTSMLGGTKLGAQYIDGLQPRYFIPVLLLVMSLVNFDFISIKEKNKEFAYGVLMLLIYLGIFSTIISGFYL